MQKIRAQKKTIWKLLLLILGILFFQNSFSQENYLEGYIVTLKGDTLHGKIDYGNWSINPSEVRFHEKSNMNIVTHTPLDIKSFGVKDEIYYSAIVKSELSTRHTSNLLFKAELKNKVDTIFLQTIIEGEKNLYYYNNKYNIVNFYIRTDEAFELLEYQKYVIKQESTLREIIKVNKKYIGQLAVYLNSCPSIHKKLGKTEYTKKSLTELFQTYYSCSELGIKFQKIIEEKSTEFGFLIGGTISTLNFSSSHHEYLDKTDYANSLNFTTGFFINIVLPRNLKKWSLYNEFIYTSYKIDGSYNDYVNEEEYVLTYSKFEYTYLKMNNMLRFKYPVKNLFIFLNAGISNGYAISGSNYMNKETKYYTIERVEEGKALEDVRKYEQGLLLGIGTIFKKYSFEIRYERGNGMSAYTELSSKSTRLHFLFGYKF